MKGLFMGPGIHPRCLKSKAKVLFSDAVALLPKVIGPVGWTKPLSTAVNPLVPEALTLGSTVNLGRRVEDHLVVEGVRSTQVPEQTGRAFISS